MFSKQNKFPFEMFRILNSFLIFAGRNYNNIEKWKHWLEGTSTGCRL